MALGFERRQASLIGGGDLPTARATGATADLSGLSRLGNTIMNAGQKKSAEDKAKQAQDDAIAGAIAGGKYVGVDENGKPKAFALPDGSVPFREAFKGAAESNLDAAFQTQLPSQFSAIQQRVIAENLPPDQAELLMRSALDGALEGSSEHLRARYREFGEGQIAQRSTYMVTKRAEQDADLQATGLNDQIKADIETAAAQGAAGLPTTEIEARIASNIDTLVGMKRVPAETAAIQKAAVNSVVAGQALTSRLATDLNAGRISPDDIDQFALGIENGSPYELLVPTEDDMGRPGRATIGYKTTSVIGKIKDDRIRGAVSQKLREAATDFRQRYEAGAKTRAFSSEFSRLGQPDHRFDMLSPGAKPEAELFMQKVLTDGKAMDNPQNMSVLMEGLRRLKFAPTGLVTTLRNMTNSGDPKQAEKAIQVYQMMTTLQNKWGDNVGKAIYADIPDKDRSLLDAWRNAYEYGVPIADIGKAMSKLNGEGAITTGDAIRAFNTMKGGDEKSFNKAFLEAWQKDFTGTYPLDAENDFTNAFRVNLALTGDAQHAFDSAYKSVRERFTASEIFTRGVEKTGIMPPTNPVGYVASRKTLFGGNGTGTEYEWLESDIRANLASAAIVEDGDLTKEKLAQLMNRPKAWYGTDFLGKTIKLDPTDSSPTQPEFKLRVFDEGGNDMGYLEVMGPDGIKRPYTINPWERHNAMSQAFQMSERKKELQAARDGQLLDKRSSLFELYNGTGVVAAPPQTDAEFDQFLKTVEPGDREKYRLDTQEIEKGFELQQKKLEETGGTVPSKARALDQQSLLQPRIGGFDVTANAVSAVDAIIPDGTGGQFMMRVASQESNFGMAHGTFRSQGDRGIFQVNTGSGFVEVVRQARSGQGRVYRAAEALKNSVLGIDVANLSAADLDKPVIAAAVARLYFLVSSRDIPQDVEGQGQLWKDHYNTRFGGGTAAQFVRSARKVPPDFSSASYLTADQG